ncbi:hypothetical protein CPB83DRAFT_112809 [Crepidotus variabilis]|uniref:Uncharacterized protein n=1 Tax=Crepidotus variabilis TaxID=179855 RepID=A0A9P6E4T6_9AGAR|nr:hypothetical protein CPB83DRAFT_112809 [Crepidotus variabilis]
MTKGFGSDAFETPSQLGPCCHVSVTRFHDLWPVRAVSLYAPPTRQRIYLSPSSLLKSRALVAFLGVMIGGTICCASWLLENRIKVEIKALYIVDFLITTTCRKVWIDHFSATSFRGCWRGR